MSLHNEIMNIPTGQLQQIAAVEETNAIRVYRMGHRDARHAAAKLSLRYEHLIEKLLDVLERLHADDFVISIREEYNLYE